MAQKETPPAAIASEGLTSSARGLWVGQRVLRKGLLDALVELDRRHGSEGMDLIPFSLFGRRAYLAVHPQHIGAVLHDTEGFKRAELFLRPFEDALGFNAVTVPADQWQTVRQRTLRFLSGKALKGYEEIMTRTLEEDTVPAWRRASAGGGAIDLFDGMLDYASKVVFSAFLGIPKESVPAHLHRTLSRIFDLVRKRVFSFVGIPPWVPTADNREFRARRGEVYRFIESHLDRSVDGDSMLGALVRAHSEAGVLDKKRLLEEMLGNLIGGSETTIILLVWTLHFLAHDPTLQERLHRELAEHRFDTHGLPRTSLLHRCLTESLRIRSPSYLAARESVRPVRVGDVERPARAHVIASQYITHNDPRVWSEPDRFDPDRFSRRPPRSTKDCSDFFPFGGGRNVCSGQAYAYQEAALALSCLLKHFRLRPGSPFDIGIRPELTLRPEKPAKAFVEERAGSEKVNSTWKEPAIRST